MIAQWRRVLPAIVLAGLALAGCDNNDDGSASSSTSSSTAQTNAPIKDDGQGFAVWPEDNGRDARAARKRLERGADEWRADVKATARHFAAEVLGWQEPVVGEPRTDAEGAGLTLSRSADGPSVDVRLAPLLSGSWWSVVSVQSDDLSAPVVSIEGSTARLNLPDLAGWQRVAVEVGYGDQVAEQEASSAEVNLELGFVPDSSGHLLVLAYDAEGIAAVFGSVIGGAGSAAG